MSLQVFAEYAIQGKSYFGHLVVRDSNRPVGLRVLEWLKKEFGDLAELVDWVILP